MPMLLSAYGTLLVGGVVYYLLLSVNKAEARIAFKHKDTAI